MTSPHLRSRIAPRGADVAQLVRAPDCGSGGRRFESARRYHSLRPTRDPRRISSPALIEAERAESTWRMEARKSRWPARFRFRDRPAARWPERPSVENYRATRWPGRPSVHNYRATRWPGRSDVHNYRATRWPGFLDVENDRATRWPGFFRVDIYQATGLSDLLEVPRGLLSRSGGQSTRRNGVLVRPGSLSTGRDGVPLRPASLVPCRDGVVSRSAGPLTGHGAVLVQQVGLSTRRNGVPSRPAGLSMRRKGVSFVPGRNLGGSRWGIPGPARRPTSRPSTSAVPAEGGEVLVDEVVEPLVVGGDAFERPRKDLEDVVAVV